MKKSIIVIICCIIAFVCFGIVSYGHFFHGRIELGILFAVLSAAQVLIAALTYRKHRDSKQDQAQ